MRRPSNRPNGPGEPSPGLRPQADALGKEAGQSSCGLKGHENLEPIALQASEALAAFQAAVLGCTCSPRASASGLSPGLGSAGPLGRFCQTLEVRLASLVPEPHRPAPSRCEFCGQKRPATYRGELAPAQASRAPPRCS